MRIPRWYTMPAREPNDRNAVVTDPQRHRVYAMEREIIGASIDTKQALDKLQAIAEHACRKWKVPPVSVYAYGSKERIFGFQAGSSIHLNYLFHGQNIGILVHELAHYITYAYDQDADDHGPEFMDIYADLLDSYKLLPRDCFMLLCARYGIEVRESEHEG